METPKKVLVVEDDPAIAAALGRRLENLGYKVMRAGTAKHGLDLADEADFMFLDMRLPDFSGEILLERLRNAGNYIPVIAMSAILTKDEAELCLAKFQIVDFMEKPFTLQEVAEKAGHAAEKVEQIRFIGKATEKIKEFIEHQNGRH